MKKEEKELLVSINSAMSTMNTVMQAMVIRLGKQANMPILFSADCEKCLKVTVHMSHIAGGELVPLLGAIKTCLACGETIYKD